jgi:ABC-type spermidine/putrescine transport system permease subunit II
MLPLLLLLLLPLLLLPLQPLSSSPGPAHLNMQLLTQRVYHTDAHAVQPTRHTVTTAAAVAATSTAIAAAAAKLSTSVQHCEHCLQS